MSVVSLPVTRRETLRLEQRVPEGYSATREEHRWHAHPEGASSNVGGKSAAEALTEAAAMLAGAAPRTDMEYRVVLTVAETRGWVVA